MIMTIPARKENPLVRVRVCVCRASVLCVCMCVCVCVKSQRRVCVEPTTCVCTVRVCTYKCVCVQSERLVCTAEEIPCKMRWEKMLR